MGSGSESMWSGRQINRAYNYMEEEMKQVFLTIIIIAIIMSGCSKSNNVAVRYEVNSYALDFNNQDSLASADVVISYWQNHSFVVYYDTFETPFNIFFEAEQGDSGYIYIKSLDNDIKYEAIIYRDGENIKSGTIERDLYNLFSLVLYKRL
ncbi:MAG: hypothetical protein GY714_20865 [Desulfobacterales bacterium]|nr:hypothetical protein [Desulfobacterales bacterium]